MKTEHTPTPWKLDGRNIIGTVQNMDDVIAEVKAYGLTKPNVANAAFIVKCVNSHSELITVAEQHAELCKLITQWAAAEQGDSYAIMDSIVAIGNDCRLAANVLKSVKGA